MSSEHIQVTTSVNELSLGQTIARHLLEKRLAASVQLVGPIVSQYWWQDALHEAREFLCLIKTTVDRYAEVEAVISELHGYEVPEIFATPMTHAPRAYRDWVDRYASGGER